MQQHKKYTLLALFFALYTVALAQTCPGPSQRTALINLQRAVTVEGTKAGQIPLTDTCGNQRYAQYVEVNLVPIAYVPTTTGNTNNLSEFVTDPAGDLWYIDWQGNAVKFEGGAGGCDQDWLQISDNSCPDNIRDSIYHYKYAAVGARYVWPGAEFMVNDSLASGILVVQGNRNARVAMSDIISGTFSMLDHGSSTDVYYLPNDGALLVKTTAGTPQSPGGLQVNHFEINTQDSTIRAYQYPNTRVDTQPIEAIYYPDAQGIFRVRPLSDVPGLGQNIYNIDGSLTGSRTVDQDGNDLTFLNGPVTFDMGGGVGPFSITNNILGNFFDISTGLSYGNTNNSMNFAGAMEFYINPTSVGVTIFDTRGITEGFEYAADYSAGFTDRSLVDRGTVADMIADSPISDAWTNGGNSFGGASSIGTNDNNNVSFEANGTTYATLTTAGRFGIGDSTPETLFDVAGTAAVVRLIGQDNTPGITVDPSGAGTGASAAIVTAQSSDLAGRFSITTGTGATNGRWATVTFASAYATTPIVIRECEDEDCASGGWYVNVSTSGFEIFFLGTPIDATTYNFAYHVIGGK